MFYFQMKHNKRTVKISTCNMPCCAVGSNNHQHSVSQSTDMSASKQHVKSHKIPKSKNNFNQNLSGNPSIQQTSTNRIKGSANKQLNHHKAELAHGRL